MRMPEAIKTRLPESSFRNEPSSDGGFTFVEILVSLLLVSLLGLVIWSGLARGENLVRRTSRGTADAVRILQLDTALRKAAGRVRVPYWETGPQVEAGEDFLRVSWLDGQAQLYLSLGRRDGLLAVGFSTEEPEGLFGPFDEITLGLMTGPDGAARGIRVAVAGGAAGVSGGRPIELQARFGGQPLRAGRSE